MESGEGELTLKTPQKGHMTTYYYRSLLKYMHMHICKEIK